MRSCAQSSHCELREHGDHALCKGGSNFYPEEKSSNPTGTHLWSEQARYQRSTMSASSAKVSRKENSNHDGADETSGNVKEWRLSSTTPFSFVFVLFLSPTRFCRVGTKLNDAYSRTAYICPHTQSAHTQTVAEVYRCTAGLFGKWSTLAQANTLAACERALAR